MGDDDPATLAPATLDPASYDVAVIGAGVVGTAVARLLSHHRLRVALIEAAPDVGTGTSKANTAILHTGFDATPGSTEARLVRRGYQLMRQLGPTAGIAIEPTGALLVAWDDEQLAALTSLAAKAAANQYHDTVIIDASELYDREPHLGPGALGALVVPDEHIVCAWTPPVVFAREAMANGATVLLSAPVTRIDTVDEGHVVITPKGDVRCRWVVNAAGLRADEIHRLLGHDSFTVTPRRGELIVFDKLARPLLSHVLLPVPTAVTKGVLVAPTVYGNVLLGPTADDVGDKQATESSRGGIDRLLAAGRRILPALLDEEVTAIYAGLRAATERSDYRIELHAEQRYLCLGGIRSTGLTASLAIAEEALGLLTGAGLTAEPKPQDEVVAVAMNSLGEIDERPWQRGGRIVCHCEQVTEAEIRGAFDGPLPAVDLDGLRRRTRALAGRCQGFYCGAEASGLAALGTGRPLTDILGVTHGAAP